MTTTVAKKRTQKPIKASTLKVKPAAKTARTRKMRTSDLISNGELRPFSVVRGKYLFWFSPENVGFSVTCQNLAGVNAQGDTFEDALAHAVSMAAFVEECQADIARNSRK